MAHHWHNIQGWFDFQDIYDEMISRAPQEGAIFIEVGTWRGKSFCYLAERVVESKKWIKLVAIDTWKGSDEDEHRNYINSIGGPDKLYYEFLTNMKNANILSFITPLRIESIPASQLWANETLDFVFIDASHHYADVVEDIKHWYPKVKKGWLS